MQSGPGVVHTALVSTHVSLSLLCLKSAFPEIVVISEGFQPVPQIVLFPAGFQPIPALASLEGLLNSMASYSTTDENTAALQQSQKAQKAVQHRGTLGFLQGFLKLQQAIQAVGSAQDQAQACFAVPLVKSFNVFAASIVGSHCLVPIPLLLCLLVLLPLDNSHLLFCFHLFWYCLLCLHVVSMEQAPQPLPTTNWASPSITSAKQEP